MNTLNIKNMNTQEKFVVMEQLWNNLKYDNTNNLSPDWHLIYYHKRRKNKFHRYETIKKSLKRLL